MTWNFQCCKWEVSGKLGQVGHLPLWLWKRTHTRCFKALVSTAAILPLPRCGVHSRPAGEHVPLRVFVDHLTQWSTEFRALPGTAFPSHTSLQGHTGADRSQRSLPSQEMSEDHATSLDTRMTVFLYPALEWRTWHSYRKGTGWVTGGQRRHGGGEAVKRLHQLQPQATCVPPCSHASSRKAPGPSGLWDLAKGSKLCMCRVTPYSWVSVAPNCLWH